MILTIHQTETGWTFEQAWTNSQRDLGATQVSDSQRRMAVSLLTGCSLEQLHCAGAVAKFVDAEGNVIHTMNRWLEYPKLRQLVEESFSGHGVQGRDADPQDYLLEMARIPYLHDQMVLTLEQILEDSTPELLKDQRHRLLLWGIFSIIGPGRFKIFAALHAWWERMLPTILQDSHEQLGRDALGALAIAQPPRQWTAFWQSLWQSEEADETWRPRIFIGLRLADPAAACEVIPDLIRYAKELDANPGPVLRGLLGQPGGREAVDAWLGNPQNPLPPPMREAVRKFLFEV